MPNTLKIKRGTAATIPQGQLAEPLFTSDTYDLYIGKGGALGNQRIQNYIASGTSSQFLKGDGSLDSTTYQTALSFSSPLVNTSGTISIPAATGSVDGYLSSTDWTTFNSKEPAITAGTNLQYYRGDKTFQTLDTAAVPENGAIYFTEPRVRSTVLTGLNLTGGGTIAATDSVLQAFGKVQNQISALVGGATYQGTWNASTNTPTLASGTGTKGYYYVVSVAGSTNLDGITDWKIGDWAIFNGTTWDKVDNTDAVSSVNGFTGAVNLALDNISDVSAASPTNAQLLRFNGTSSLWENWTPTFEPALTKGNLTEATSSVLTITGGTGAVIGSGTTIEVKNASASQNGVVTTGTQTLAGLKTFQVSGSYVNLAQFYNDTNTKSLFIYSDPSGTGISNLTAFGGEGIYFYNGGNYLEFSTNGNPRARITNTGLEVGYTTTQGTYKLDVNGTARIASTLTLGGALSGTSATFSGNLETQTNGNSPQFRIKDTDYTGQGAYAYMQVQNGSLYIGNATDTFGSLSDKLIISSTGAATFSSNLQVNSYQIINGIAGGTSTYLQFNNNGTAIGYVGSSAAINSGASTSVTLGVASGAGLTIASTGAATFSSSVTAGGTITQASSAATLILNRTGGTTYGAGVQYQTSGTNNWIVGTGQTTVGTDYQIYNYSLGAGALAIQYSTNKVGIGTTSPTRLLELSKTGGVDFGLTSVSSGSAEAIFKGYASGTNIDATTSRGTTLNLINLDTTNGNANAIVFNNSNQLATSYIVGVNVNHTTRTGDLVFGTSNSAAPTERMRITSGGAIEATGSIKTGAPSGGTAKPWKFGSRVSASGGGLNSGEWIELDVDGTLYKLALFVPL